MWRKIVGFIQGYSRLSSPKKSFLTNKYHAIFAIFLALIAVLARNNPLLVYPEILWLLALFVGSNFLTNHILTNMRIRYWLIDLVVVWNCLLIGGIVYYSGGPHSYLWVMYLLPVLTAAILLETRQLVWTTLLTVAFNALFYGDPISSGWDPDLMYELAGKSGVLIIGAILMRSAAAEKEKVEDELDAEREKLDRLSQEAVSYRKQVTQDSREAAGILEVGQMTAGIVHDLGTPISIILGSARLVSMEEDLPERGKSDIKRIIDAALLCKNIISNTLSIAKGDKYPLEPLDLRDPLDSAISIASPLLSEKKVALTKHMADKMPKINGNFTYLERLFLNLIFNAMGALPGGGQILLTIKPSKDGQTLTAMVEDSGKGFPDTILQNGPKTFLSTKKPGEGTGLGLVVCQRIVHNHQGSIEFSNREKGGARISITFPVANTAPQPEQA